jgi:hypothetical protein
MRCLALVFGGFVIASCKQAPVIDAAPDTTGVSSNAPTPSVTTHAAQVPGKTEAAQPYVPPTVYAANTPKPLAMGLSIKPPFRYTLDASANNVSWTLEDAPQKSQSPIHVWLMEKSFTPEVAASGARGETLPCANKAEGAGKKEADGSYTFRCKGSASDDGTWFGRAVGVEDDFIQSFICMGSNKDPQKVALIEKACRSIRKTP